MRLIPCNYRLRQLDTTAAAALLLHQYFLISILPVSKPPIFVSHYLLVPIEEYKRLPNGASPVSACARRFHPGPSCITPEVQSSTNCHRRNIKIFFGMPSPWSHVYQMKVLRIPRFENLWAEAALASASAMQPWWKFQCNFELLGSFQHSRVVVHGLNGSVVVDLNV